MNTCELLKAVKAKFGPPEYAIFTEVANGTGSHAGRWADAICMGIWPSRGLNLTGFELKVSRGDWLKELKTPAKAESIFRYCDFWYVVAGDESIVAGHELPETWGLIIASKRGLSITKPAPKLVAEPISRSFLAAMLRRACEQSADAAALQEARKEGYDKGVTDGKSYSSQAAKELERIRENLRKFEEASGIRIDGYTYNAGKIGAAVKSIMAGAAAEQLSELGKTAQRIAEIANQAVAELGGTANELDEVAG